jgi:hypothetical protein
LHVVNGAGDSTNWTPAAGANWSNVNAFDPYKYVEVTAGGLEDLYHINSPIPIASVSFVKVGGSLDSQAHMGTQLALKSGITTTVSASFKGACGFRDINVPGYNYGYEYRDAYWRLNPDSGLPFTEADIQNLQIGLRS